MRKLLIFGILLIAAAIVLGCTGQKQTTNNTQIANPASVYCEDQGYTLEIRTDANGGQAGYCIFGNGAECDEWAYYRGECSPTVEISIRDSAFNPAEITIKKGWTVLWMNDDSMLHDVTMDNGAFDHDISSGESFSYTFTETGTYDYHCDIHTSMKGKIVVE